MLGSSIGKAGKPSTYLFRKRTMQRGFHNLPQVLPLLLSHGDHRGGGDARRRIGTRPESALAQAPEMRARVQGACLWTANTGRSDIVATPPTSRQAPWRQRSAGLDHRLRVVPQGRAGSAGGVEHVAPRVGGEADPVASRVRRDLVEDQLGAE